MCGAIGGLLMLFPKVNGRPTQSCLRIQMEGPCILSIRCRLYFSLPVQWLFGPEFGIQHRCHFQLCAVWLGILVVKPAITGDSTAAGVSLVIFGAAPHILGQAYNGISETVCAGWVPLTLWALLRNIKNPKH